MSAPQFDLSKMGIGDLRQLIGELSYTVSKHVQSSLDAVKAAIEKGLASVDQTIPSNYQFDIRIESKDGKFNLTVYKFAPIVNGQTAQTAAATAVPSAPVVNTGVQNGSGGNGKFQGTDALIKYAQMHKVDITAYLEGGKVKTGVNSFRVLKELNPGWKGIANDVILAQIQAM